MKIVIFNPKDSFTSDQQKRLAKLGQVLYTKTRDSLPEKKYLEMASRADVIGCDPDPLGGFEIGKGSLTKIIESATSLKGICLSTTSFGWIDLDLCKKNNISVSNVPGYSRESVAESVLAFMLGAAKRIFISDRRTQKNKYVLTQGFELKGKTLGVIGLGSIGSRVAELGLGIGMTVVAYNRTPMKMKGVKMVTLNELLKKSDFISLNTTHEKSNKWIIDKSEISKMKKGVFIINTADQDATNEKELAKALKSGMIDTYVYEGEDLGSGPLGKLENAIGFQGFAWFTKEALENLYEIFVQNVIATAKGKPQNLVSK